MVPSRVAVVMVSWCLLPSKYASVSNPMSSCIPSDMLLLLKFISLVRIIKFSKNIFLQRFDIKSVSSFNYSVDVWAIVNQIDEAWVCARIFDGML